MSPTRPIFLLLSMFLMPAFVEAACSPDHTDLAPQDGSGQLTVDELTIEGLEALFQSLATPRKNHFLHRSVRLKKYDLTKKNIAAVKGYLETLDLQNKEKCAEAQDLLRRLNDQILWVDDFKLMHLKYFSSAYYAENFFKKNDTIIGVQAPENERKKHD